MRFDYRCPRLRCRRSAAHLMRDRFPKAHALGYVDCAAPRRRRLCSRGMLHGTREHTSATQYRTSFAAHAGEPIKTASAAILKRTSSLFTFGDDRAWRVKAADEAPFSCLTVTSRRGSVDAI